jgi:Alpha/beta hydrolase domain
VVTDTKGDPLDLPENVRTYLIANTPHFAPFSAKPARVPACQYETNPLHAGAPMQALLVAMDAWLDGVEPPASRYPSRKDGTFVLPQQAVVGIPAIPGFNYTGVVDTVAALDHSTIPPKIGPPYPVYVGRTDGDGHTIAGVRMPALDAPTATYFGFNYRKAGYAEGELCDLVGTTLPLAKTKAERATRVRRSRSAIRQPAIMPPQSRPRRAGWLRIGSTSMRTRGGSSNEQRRRCEIRRSVRRGQNVAILATKLGPILRACHGTEDARRFGPDAASQPRVPSRGDSGTVACYELSFPKSQYEPKNAIFCPSLLPPSEPLLRSLQRATDGPLARRGSSSQVFDLACFVGVDGHRCERRLRIFSLLFPDDREVPDDAGRARRFFATLAARLGEARPRRRDGSARGAPRA